MLSCSVMSDSLQLHGLWPSRLLCPSDLPSKITGLGCYFLLQGLFPTQGSNPRLPHLLHWQADTSPLSHLEAFAQAVPFTWNSFLCFHLARDTSHPSPESLGPCLRAQGTPCIRFTCFSWGGALFTNVS